ncbi:PQQ-binding-like beta-propeller repeat protein [Streptomyces sp. NPDC047525]|uniref:serine/threonine-protein kinase n=1 Tax=Streptomyces sp. NPDC047525 TaxID=3155264 RepID=UPI0033F0EA63
MAQAARGEPVELGGFRIVARLGEGGMGRVHLARSASGRLAAVKTVHEHLAAEPEFRERFRRETVAARAVAGPFTAAVIDADPDAAQPWLATEFCAGPDLTAAVRAHGPLGSAGLAALGAALAEALAGVHAVGLMHRDLKPSNIVIGRDGPKVLDFGIAKSAADESLTADDEAIGSPGFIAPEQLAHDGEPGPAADVFALGAVLVLAATGRAPFGTGGAPAVLYRTLHDEPDLEGVPGALWHTFLGRCLARDPADRPAVGEALAWCGELADDAPWWEREPVSGLVRRHEDEVAELVAQLVSEPVERDTGDSSPDITDERPEDPPEAAPRDGAQHPPRFAPRDGRADAPPPPPGHPSRRRLLTWGGAALGAAGVAATAVVVNSLGGGTGGSGGEDRAGGEAKDGAWPDSVLKGRVRWTREVGELPFNGALSRSGGDLYLIDGAALTRIDAQTNTVRWTYPSQDLKGAEPLGDLVYVLKDGLFEPELIALHTDSGRQAWNSGSLIRNPHRPRRPFSRPKSQLEGNYGKIAASEEAVALISYTSYGTAQAQRTSWDRRWRAYGFDPRTGDPLWFHEGSAAEVIGVDQAGGRIAVAVSAAPDLGTDAYAKDDPLVVLRAGKGTVEREIEGGAPRPQAHPGAEGTRYYATSESIQAVDLATRRTVWTQSLKSGSTVTPRATDGMVHAPDAGGRLRGFNATSGEPRWMLDNVRELAAGDNSPLVADGLLYVAGPRPGASGEPTWGLRALDPGTGATVWAVALDDIADVDAAAARDGLVHLWAGGTLHTISGPGPA